MLMYGVDDYYSKSLRPFFFFFFFSRENPLSCVLQKQA